MTTWEKARLALTSGALCALSSSGVVAAVSDYAVRISATVQTNPPSIMLSWPGDPNAVGYTQYRKLRDAADWGTGVALGANATNFVDSTVSVGDSYEYWVAKDAGTYFADGYIYAGIEVPLVESRGKVVLLVDNTYAASLSNELSRLRQDLVGDGWIVLRHDVARMAVDPANTSSSVWAARSNELADVKALITADYNSDTNNVKAVFLFGHVPVPYSGNMAPDDHYDHVGAWPADAFYGDMDGIWTDFSVISTDVSDQRTRNVPSDGKFDQTDLPSDLELQVGRVDFAHLPSFSLSEAELLRLYLTKDHNFRHKLITAERRGLIDDNLGIQGGWEAFAANGWRTFAPFFGPTNTFAGNWLTALSTQSYLWGYGCGAGTYASCSGVATTSQMASNDPRVVFTMLFGSYFGDWDSQDSFLRAQLATPNYTLASVWAGRPFWILHHMALGETIGFSTRLTQNNSALYSADLFSYYVHVALMGDPTLRMHVVAPPSALLVVSNGSGGVVLSWTASPDTVLGYHVYSAPTAAGPFTRLTTSLVAGTTYTDPLISSNVYMVRAVKLEPSGSGTYFNASQGIFQSVDSSAGMPEIIMYQPTNNALFVAPATIQLAADTFDPANSVTNVEFYADGVKIGDASEPPYGLIWSNVGGGPYSVMAVAVSSVGPPASSSAVTVLVDNGGKPQLTLKPLGANSYALTGDEVLGRVYRIQSSQDLSATNWQTLGTAAGSASGTFQFILTPNATLQFYRSAYP